MTEKPRHADTRSHFARDLVIWILGVAFFGALTFGLLAFFADPTTPIDSTGTSTTSSSTSTTATTPESTTTTDGSTSTTSTTVAVRPPSEVTVRVFNYPGGVPGAAGRLTQRLAQDGYRIMPATDYPDAEDPSRLWYRDGFAAEAAELLRFVPGARVEALPDESFSPGADVIIILGSDYEE